MKGIVCATKGCQRKHLVTRYGRPTFANGEWDDKTWNEWRNDPAMKEEVDLVLRLEGAARAWTQKYRASVQNKDDYRGQHTVKEREEKGKENKFNKANSGPIQQLHLQPVKRAKMR